MNMGNAVLSQLLLVRRRPKRHGQAIPERHQFPVCLLQLGASALLTPRKVSLVNDNTRILAQISESLRDPCSQHRYALAVTGSKNRRSADGKADESSPRRAGGFPVGD